MQLKMIQMFISEWMKTRENSAGSLKINQQKLCTVI